MRALNQQQRIPMPPFLSAREMQAMDACSCDELLVRSERDFSLAAMEKFVLSHVCGVFDAYLSTPSDPRTVCRGDTQSREVAAVL